ncbi:MAG: DNA primase [Spirochaetes bacterium]|nr:DNA primase [Spirochaetota bacterium]MBN2770781.1 DNA primase [Spirochaetota bacterium]
MARIEHVIARYIPTMQKRGENLLALCPFHKEKTPSFTISPAKQIFHCFGCHEGGNVFTFVQKIERVNFPRSVEIVADIVGFDLPRTNDPEAAKKARVYRILDYAARSFRNALSGSAARKYVEKRGVTPESIDIFELGFAPDSWDYIKNGLDKKGIALNEGLECGLLGHKKETGRYYDMFRNRLMFPIRDINGKCLGFGGRVLDDSQPKYLNSPESAVFSKRSVLYGLNLAAEEIRSLNRVIVVEGYLDVIGAYQSGIKNVVAPLGTALTEAQLTVLSHMCSEIVLLFDSDAAGAKAALRTVSASHDFNASIRIGSLPEGDPFEYILKNGPRKLLMHVDTACSPAEFRLRSHFKANSHKETKLLLREMFEILNDYQYEAEKEEGVTIIAALLNIRKDSVQLDYQKYKGVKPAATVTATPLKQKNFVQRSVEELIVLMLNYPSLIEKAMMDFHEFDIDDPLLKNLINTIFDLYEHDENVTGDKIFDIIEDNNEKRFLSERLSADYNIESPESAYTEIYLNMKIHAIDVKLTKFNEALKKCKDSSDSSRILTEIDIWRREKEKLSGYIYSKNASMLSVQNH